MEWADLVASLKEGNGVACQITEMSGLAGLHWTGRVVSSMCTNGLIVADWC